MEQINDYYRYTQLMRNGFYDKMFFIDKIFDPWESLLDFGCADGFETKMLAQIFPEKKFIGYDSEKEMVTRAIYTGSLPGNVRFTDNPEDVTSGDVINLTSVVHEVYSYGTKESVAGFWSEVFCPTRKFVILRDMSYSNRMQLDHVHSYGADTEILTYWFIKNGLFGELQRFIEHFGALTESKNFLHLLLKYPYVHSPNWMREVHENYLPISVEDLIYLAPEGWVLDYKETYTLPFLKYKWRTELGIETDLHTHVKLIFRNTKP